MKPMFNNMSAVLWVICSICLLNGGCRSIDNRPQYPGQNPIMVASPDGKLKVTIITRTCGTSPSQQRLYYQVHMQDRQVMPEAPLGVTMDGPDGDFVCGLKLTGQSDTLIKETYDMPVGKKSRHVNHAHEKTLFFTNQHGKAMELIVRVYDDAVAWRYRFNGQGSATILSEASAFRFPAETTGWLQSYIASYENFYDQTGRGAAQHYGMTALFKIPTGVWVLLTEAAVYGDYAGSGLTGTLDGQGLFTITLPSPLNGQLPWTSPWRVAIIGNCPATIVESVVVDNLNPPCELNDLSWIKPGRVTFPWWSDEHVSGNFEKLKAFVDFASEMGWEWIEFDTALLGDVGYEGSDTWMTTPWVPQLIEYARAKNVNVYGWNPWKNLDTPEKREKIFSLYSKLGIKGVKIDFLDSDSQERFRFRDAVALDAIRHKLMLSFHGETIPRGQQRRWPHIMTWEATHGAEWYMNWSKNPSPVTHNCILPFTRNAVGSMDYTPVTFSTDRRKTTDAHELALSVIFESGWQCLADSPESYAKNPGTPFLRQVPAAWDDIHFIDGHPGRFVCLARRKGSDWFVAAINADEPRTIHAALDFLTPGIYHATLYRDSITGKEMTIEEITVDTREALQVATAAGGGFAVRFSQ
jgi:alpha-glucosidase